MRLLINHPSALVDAQLVGGAEERADASGKFGATPSPRRVGRARGRPYVSIGCLPERSEGCGTTLGVQSLLRGCRDG